MKMVLKGISPEYLGILKHKRKKSNEIKDLFEKLLDQDTEIDITQKWHRFTLRMPKSLYQLLEFEADNNDIGLAEMARILLREAIMERHL